ncbi:MAG: DNA repair protein RecN [Candidatus Melainabacteria bacterium GWF2_32_7]|nr:MAG: DNA repair protein RecN [Candidatus Melainabacteria bacterium GWF2_32_7]
MIKTITIKDFVLIDELKISFDKGLNILTGETGSGKSVIIDAIDLGFGSRASKDQIKTGANKALIELNIQINQNFPIDILNENEIDIEEDKILTISREITQNATRSRINGVLVSQSFVQTLRTLLVDIHSQHETYNYLQPKTHTGLLDGYGQEEHKKLLIKYKNNFSEYKSTQKELEIAQSQIQTGIQKIDFLKFQIEEISNAKIQNINEYDELMNERSILLNSEELKEITHSGYELLYNQDSSIIDILNSIKNKLIKASEFDENLSKLAEIIDSSSINLKEAANELRDYAENLETNPAKLNQVEERIEILDKLKRKYGSKLSNVLNNLEKFELELSEINFSDEKLQELSKKVTELKKETESLAEKLSNSRKELASALSDLIQNKLVKLEMPKVKFKINIEPAKELSYKGIDEVEFLISPNTGEPLKPLAKIASGGEISRVILAIKTIFAKSDNVNTVIFDEIDTGISGKTSQAVAETLAELGFSRQVLCITHQPIIAAMADKHLYINKTQDENSTTIFIDELNQDEKINALAALASGSADEDSLKFAASLLQQAKEFKKSNNFLSENCFS